MQKIMFNDRYGLTEAVLEGIKTNTRRIEKISEDDIRSGHWREKTRYKVGEVVAIAQSYRDCAKEELQPKFKGQIYPPYHLYDYVAGWGNKMFVDAYLMPHHIKITDIRVERLQDISDEDCLKEGIIEAERDSLGRYVTKYGFEDTKNPYGHYFNTPREAFIHLIDKVGKKGTWESNPYVFVYDFELVD